VKNLVYLPSREVEAAFARGADLLVVPVGGTREPLDSALLLFGVTLLS